MSRKSVSRALKGSRPSKPKNHNLGMPSINRHSNFLYFSYYLTHFIDICKMHMLYENVHEEYMKVTVFYNNIDYKILYDCGVFGSLASGFSHNGKIQRKKHATNNT